MAKINVQNTEITIVSHNDDDYISLTDMARSQLQEHIIFRWLSLKNTIGIMGSVLPIVFSLKFDQKNRPRDSNLIRRTDPVILSVRSPLHRSKMNNKLMKTTHFTTLLLLMAMTVSEPLSAQHLVSVTPDKNNQKVIKRYNCYSHRQGYPGETVRAVGYTAVFGVKKNSVMSTDDVEVNVVKRWVQDAVIDDMENRMYFIEIKNKSDQTLYIDKSRCFRIYHDSTRYCYFVPERDDTSYLHRVLAIPPHKKKNLSDYHAVVINNGKYPEVKIIDYPEDFHWDAKAAGICEGYLADYEVRLFTEDNSPYYRSFEIAYSKDEDFSTYSLLTINFYMRQLIGCFYPELYRDNDIFDLLGGNQYTITNCEYGYGGVNRFRRNER